MFILSQWSVGDNHWNEHVNFDLHVYIARPCSVWTYSSTFSWLHIWLHVRYAWLEQSFIIRIRHSLDQYTPVTNTNAPITGRQQHATWKGPCYHFRRLLCYVTSLESWRIHPSVFLHVAMSLYDINILYGECATDKRFAPFFPKSISH